MLKQGTTLIEAKTGYGLELETEIKLLKVLTKCQSKLELSITYLGAHSVPQDSTAEKHTHDIINHHIGKLHELQQAKEIRIDNIDVFCEKGVFTTEQSREILQAGMGVLKANANFHGDELNPTASAEMGAEIGAAAISHLEHISDDGIKAMATSGTVAVLLPTTAYILRLVPPPARKMIDAGVKVALGSDFNPNAHCLAMPFVMNLACVLMKMTLPEALVAATINSAESIKKSATHGSIEVGKVGDFVIIASPRWEHIAYQMVDPPIKHVIKHGAIVFSTKDFTCKH